MFESEPGDVLCFAVPLFHASFGGALGRRQGVMVYYEDPQDEVTAAAVVKQMRGNHGIFAALGRQMYPAFWRGLALGESPLHAHWLE